MTKIVVFSDLHVHPHKFGSAIDPVTGRQNRLQDCIDVLDATAACAEDYDAKARIFVGDLFHVRGRIAPSVMNPVVEHFQRMGKAGFRDIWMPGNHDMEARSGGEHALTPLSVIPGVTIASEPCIETAVLDGMKVGIGIVPYEPDIDKLKANVEMVAAQRRLWTGASSLDKTICLIHHGVDGAMPGIPDAGFGVANLPVDDFDFVFCGDYHNHKELIPGKAWMVGSPLQHNFGDAGEARGWMVVDLKDGKAEFIENTKAPQFVTWEVRDGKPLFRRRPHCTTLNNCFVRVRHDDEKELAKMEAAALKQGARAVMKELVKDWKAVDRADVSLTMTTRQLFETWLDKQELGFLPREDVLKLNDEILTEAGVA